MAEQTHTKLEYSKITEYLYLGTNMCCQTHFEMELLDKGITADISLEKERLDAPYGVDSFLWLPTLDHAAPTYAQLMLGVQMIDTLVKLKQKIYIHCKNGHGRGSTLLAAYFIQRGLSPQKAIAKIREKRPAIHLTDHQTAILEAFASEIA